MGASRLPRLWLLIVTAIAAMFGFAGLAISQIGPAPVAPAPTPLPAHPSLTLTPAGLLTRPIPDSTPDAALVRRGQALAIVGDCMSCHLRPGGQPFAGGLGLNTPFGTIYSSNITPDPRTGIGGWTGDQFYRAMHEGVDAHGRNLYPAFPYPWFTRVSRADTDAILAFLKTNPAVDYTPPANRLPFPLNIRAMVKVWNLLFFKPGEFQPTPGRSAEWNHGAYIVQGLGHCGGCHTPKNLLGADRKGRDLQGGLLDNWVAPDLTANPRTGLGAWSPADVTELLHTGRNGRAAAGGSMGEVVSFSTALMSDADRQAVAVYLQGMPASPALTAHVAEAGAMTRGAAIYSDACASCHLDDGVGQPGLFPPMGGDAMLQQHDPTGLAHLILAGSRVGATPTRPSPLTMPSFAWKLSDQEVADVSTYIRNSWGNRAEPVSAAQIGRVRRTLKLQTTRLTVNSGDQPQPVEMH